MAGHWTPNHGKEQQRLGNAEDDWGGLAGTGSPVRSRTRKQRKKTKHFGDSSDGSFSEESDTLSSEGSNSSEAWFDVQDVKPAPTRLILEPGSLHTPVERNMTCSSCKGKVEMNFNTVTIATTAHVQCSNRQCSFIDCGNTPAPCELPQFGDNRERNTDCAVNVLHVLSNTANGDGGIEACRTPGLLGLPNDTTMETQSFQVIEERIAPVIWDVHNQTLLKNLKEEVRLTTDRNKHALCLKSIDAEDEFRLDEADYPFIDGSFDMGWHQRGKLMNSPSGHSFLCGEHSRKPVAGSLKCKVCSTCAAWKKQCEKKGLDHKTTPTPEHHCLKNHTGSSGSMEPAACVDIAKRLHCSFHLNLRQVVMDDDASSRQAIRWCNADWLAAHPGEPLEQVPKKAGKNKGDLHDRPDSGNLPGDTPEPICVADPNHRRKQLTGDMLELTRKLVEERHTITRMDTKHIGKNFAYVVRSSSKMPETKHEEEQKQCWNTTLMTISSVAIGVQERS